MRNVVSALAVLLVLPTVVALEIPSVEVEVPETPEWSTLLGPWAVARILTPIDGLDATGVIEITGDTWVQRAYTVERIAVYVDDRYLGNAEGTDAWTFALDTSRLVDGAHTLTVRAFAAPTAMPHHLTAGWGETVRFASHNEDARDRVILYEEVVAFTGESSTRWVHRLQADHIGLRVVIEKEAGGLIEPRGEATVHYVDLDAITTGELRAVRAWHATYDEGGYYATATHGAHDLVTAPGLLVLNGHFTGEGKLRIRVEALALDETQAQAERAAQDPLIIDAGARTA